MQVSVRAVMSGVGFRVRSQVRCVSAIHGSGLEEEGSGFVGFGVGLSDSCLLVTLGCGPSP
jgi:hypothetical protein